MTQAGRGAGFLFESPEMLCIRSRRHDFDRDVAMQTRIAGTIDFAHPARADERQDLVRSKTGATLEHQWRLLIMAQGRASPGVLAVHAPLSVGSQEDSIAEDDSLKPKQD
jgi:hypothetical protein